MWACWANIFLAEFVTKDWQFLFDISCAAGSGQMCMVKAKKVVAWKTSYFRTMNTHKVWPSQVIYHYFFLFNKENDRLCLRHYYIFSWVLFLRQTLECFHYQCVQKDWTKSTIFFILCLGVSLMCEEAAFFWEIVTRHFSVSDLCLIKQFEIVNIEVNVELKTTFYLLVAVSTFYIM